MWLSRFTNLNALSEAPFRQMVTMGTWLTKTTFLPGQAANRRSRPPLAMLELPCRAQSATADAPMAPALDTFASSLKSPVAWEVIRAR